MLLKIGKKNRSVFGKLCLRILDFETPRESNVEVISVPIWILDDSLLQLVTPADEWTHS